MKEIQLTQGKVALVDDEDFEYLSQWKWRFDNGYATSNTSGSHKTRKKILMHRLVMNTPDDMETDHINGNRSDNRKSNLRVCNVSENQRNRGKPKNNPSGHKGIRITPNLTWNARLIHNGICVLNKNFPKKEDAIFAREEATKYFHGEFARTQ